MSQSKSKPLCETEYLLRSPANARRLVAAIKEVEETREARALPQKGAAEHGRRYSSDDLHAFGSGALGVKVA
jgi:hypothetical protein